MGPSFSYFPHPPFSPGRREGASPFSPYGYLPPLSLDGSAIDRLLLVRSRTAAVSFSQGDDDARSFCREVLRQFSGWEKWGAKLSRVMDVVDFPPFPPRVGRAGSQALPSGEWYLDRPFFSESSRSRSFFPKQALGHDAFAFSFF